MNTLLNYEKEYCDNLDKLYKCLVKTYDLIKSHYNISLDKNDVTKAILFRMKAYYDTQENIKTFLNKRYRVAASDFFVETIAFYLKLILELKSIGFEVHCEKSIRHKRGSLRPDISIWDKDDVISIIECKTQFGWNRDKWEEDFHKREFDLKKEFPNAMAYLVVLTSENWPGFNKEDKKVGNQYFALSSVWPSKINVETIDDIIENPIENLVKRIIKKEK